MGGRGHVVSGSPSEHGKWLLSHEHLEVLLDGDAVAQIIVVGGEASRMV